MSEHHVAGNENMAKAWAGLRQAFQRYKDNGHLTEDEILQLGKDWQRYKFAAATLRVYDVTPPHLLENPDSDLMVALTTLRGLGYIDPFPPI